MFELLGRLVPRLRFVLVAAWVVAAVGFGVLGPSLAQVGSADETSFLPKDAESLAARNVIREAFPGDASPAQALIVFERQTGLTDADRAAIDGLRSWLGGAEDVGNYVTAESSPSLASMYRSGDGKIELARVDLRSAAFLPATNRAIDAIRAHLAEPGALPGGLTAELTGQAGIGRDYLKAIQDGTDRTTIVTVVLVVLVLLLIYRAPLAALVPLLTIGAAFLVSRGVLGFLAQGGWKLSSVLDSFIVVLVFGVGTDYTIFLISRFREELSRNRYPDAVRLTVSRISSVITASAATVMIGLATMAVARFGMIQTTGPALAITIFITLLAGLTLTPSLLAIFGRRLFWPLHEQTRTGTEEGRGFWAALAARITARPGLIAAAILVVLALPALALPQLKQSFDVLNELPSAAESRQGFEALAQHLGQGQLQPLNVLVSVPGADLASPAQLARVQQLASRVAALPDVQAVRSIVDPTGSGRVPDGLRPRLQLAAIAQQFSAQAPAATDLATQLSDTALAGINAARAYVAGVGSAFPDFAATDAFKAASTDLTTLEQGIVQGRAQALVSNQLQAIALRLQVAAGQGPTPDAATQLAALKAYLDELPKAAPDVVTEPAFQAAQSDVAIAAAGNTAAVAPLMNDLRQLAAWFQAKSAPVYFQPASVGLTPEAQAAAKALADARDRLPAELDQLATAMSADAIYLPATTGPSGGSSGTATTAQLLASYDSPTHDVTRLYVTTKSDPYDTAAFSTVRLLRETLASEAATFGPGARTYVGGATAEFTDVQTTISQDFLWVAGYTVLGILLVLIVLLRTLFAPAYLVATVLLSYATSLSLSALFLQRVLGQAGLNYFIPLIVFVLLVALGSDYNIFLMARVREEAAAKGVRGGMRVASARTGTVITSAGLILAGTFGALISSPLQLLFQVGVAVALGVLIDTFVVRSLLVPAITAFLGELTWWPSRSAYALAGAPAGTAPAAAWAGGGSGRSGEAALLPARGSEPEAGAAASVEPASTAPAAAQRRIPRPHGAGHLLWIVPLAAGIGIVAWLVVRSRRRGGA